MGVEADNSGLSQNMVIHSEDALDSNYHRLKDLDVQRCQSSRKEDKDYILAKIPDVGAFNSHLQHLIFGSEGLFKAVTDAANQTATAGRIVKRCLRRTSARRPSAISAQ